MTTTAEIAKIIETNLFKNRPAKQTSDLMAKHIESIVDGTAKNPYHLNTEEPIGLYLWMNSPKDVAQKTTDEIMQRIA